MIVEMDRIAREMESWNKREDALTQQFRDPHFANKRHVLEEKLKYMELLREGYKNQVLLPGERSTMRILKGQIKDLERRLYPNLVERLIRRITRGLTRSGPGAISSNVPTVQEIGPSNSPQKNNAAHTLDNQQKPDNSQNQNEKNQSIKNDQKNNRMTNEYKNRFSLRNSLKQTGKKIKHRLR